MMNFKATRSITNVLSLTHRITASSFFCRQPNRVSFLSTKSSAAVDGLRSALEEYRQTNYSCEVPLRFKKEIVAAACSAPTSVVSSSSSSSTTGSNDVGTDAITPISVSYSAAGSVRLEGLNRVLNNIGLQDRVSQGDLEALFQEEGDVTGAIPANHLVRML